MTTAVVAPFRFFSLHVVRARRVGASLVRITFAGPDLEHFFSDGYDQSLSLFLPQPGQSEPQVPFELGDGWWQAWREPASRVPERANPKDTGCRAGGPCAPHRLLDPTAITRRCPTCACERPS